MNSGRFSATTLAASEMAKNSTVLPFTINLRRLGHTQIVRATIAIKSVGAAPLILAATFSSREDGTQVGNDEGNKNEEEEEEEKKKKKKKKKRSFFLFSEHARELISPGLFAVAKDMCGLNKDTRECCKGSRR